MPELPEVQSLVDALIGRGVVGRRIKQASVYWPKTVATPTVRQFCKKIVNAQIEHIQRRGKFIVIHLDHGMFLAVHLRMSGRFQWDAPSTPLSPHVHIVFDLTGGIRLNYHDTRKFGRFYLTKQIGDIIGSLGPEPLASDFTSKKLSLKLNGRHRQIKPLLLDQTFLAGLGNIYVDEALWRSGIHPQRSAHSLNSTEVKSLHRAIRHVLRQGIRNGGTSLGNGLGNYSGLTKTEGNNGSHLKVFRRSGQACFKCGYQIERVVVGQRGTHICRRCQKMDS